MKIADSKSFLRLLSKKEEDYQESNAPESNISLLNRIGEPRAIVAIPSLSFSPEELVDLKGIPHYESRGLWQILAAADPMIEVIFITTLPVPDCQIKHLINCHPAGKEILTRVHFISLQTIQEFNGHKPIPLSQILFSDKKAIQKIKEILSKFKDKAILSPFVSSELEFKIAEALEIPLMGADLKLKHFGTKSMGRQILEESRVRIAPGIIDIYSRSDLTYAVESLWAKYPNVNRFVIKLNEGVSGMGNAKLILPRRSNWKWKRARDIQKSVMKMTFEAPSMTVNQYLNRLAEIGGVLEAFIRGKKKFSPSAQGFIHADGRVEIFSTHDQTLGGSDGQVYVGALFPAEELYRLQLQDLAQSVGNTLSKKGIIGPYAVDFVVVKKGYNSFARNKNDIFAIEINLRQGGTTHPYRTVRALCGATYEQNTGNLLDIDGRPLFYISNDNLQSEYFINMDPLKIVSALEKGGVLFNPETREGSVLHMLGAIPTFGKFGATWIAHDKSRLFALQDRFHSILRSIEQLQQE